METIGFLGALAKAKSPGSALVAHEGGVVMALEMGIDFVMRGSACCGTPTSSADGKVPPSHEVERDLHVAGRLL